MAIFPQMDANHRELYQSARYRGLISVALGLKRPPTDRATYILIPRIEDPDFIADHNKALGRVPVGRSMFTLLGSHEYLHRSWDRSDEQILADSIACASRYHGDVGADLEQQQIVRWEEVVPVLDTGRFKLIASFKSRLNTNARVQFASDLDRIPGVNGAIVSGIEAAQRLERGSKTGISTPIIGICAMGAPQLDVDDLLATARRRTGLADFGPPLVSIYYPALPCREGLT
jgi:protoporphyrinogen/coproporphyrinogen III oxidase